MRGRGNWVPRWVGEIGETGNPGKCVGGRSRAVRYPGGLNDTVTKRVTSWAQAMIDQEPNSDPNKVPRRIQNWEKALQNCRCGDEVYTIVCLPTADKFHPRRCPIEAPRNVAILANEPRRRTIIQIFVGGRLAWAMMASTHLIQQGGDFRALAALSSSDSRFNRVFTLQRNKVYGGKTGSSLNLQSAGNFVCTVNIADRGAIYIL